jgi:hypothetical protein
LGRCATLSSAKNFAETSFVPSDLAAILDRHTTRRIAGVPTVSVLVGPIGAGGRTWRRWATATGRRIVTANQRVFPCAEWVRAAAEQLDLPAAAVSCLARRAGRNPDEFLAAWRNRTPADCERLWRSLPPQVDDDLLRAVADLAVGQVPWAAVAVSLSAVGEKIVPIIVRLASTAAWPGILFAAGSTDDLAAIAQVAASWAVQVPAVPSAVAVPAEVWAKYLAAPLNSRAKALLREGELVVPLLDTATVERTLAGAGSPASVAAVFGANGVDAELVEAAVAVVRATVAPAQSEAASDRARSAAERFLFEFLESMPETAGKFELNATLDFRFGPRPAEVDLLCREPRIALEIDGYYHFQEAAGYRRDRAKDWELQKRGYLVLRFLAEDVIPQFELIRDRLLDALTRTPTGGPP